MNRGLVATAGVTGLPVFGLRVAGCAIFVRWRAAMSAMPAVSAVRAMHEQVANDHQADQAISDHRANCHFENEDGGQRGDDAGGD